MIAYERCSGFLKKTPICSGDRKRDKIEGPGGCFMDEDARTLTKDDKVYDLVDVVEEDRKEVLPADILDDRLVGIVSKVTERVARELFPSVAEKVIREEVDKLKKKLGE